MNLYSYVYSYYLSNSWKLFGKLIRPIHLIRRFVIEPNLIRLIWFVTIRPIYLIPFVKFSNPPILILWWRHNLFCAQQSSTTMWRDFQHGRFRLLSGSDSGDSNFYAVPVLYAVWFQFYAVPCGSILYAVPCGSRCGLIPAISNCMRFHFVLCRFAVLWGSMQFWNLKNY